MSATGHVVPPAPPDAPEPPHPEPPLVARPPVLAGAAAGWRTALREFATIVAGVLCALAAQAWWQGHEERGRERDYLRQLLSDTRENERRLDEAIATDSAAARSAALAIDALTGTGAPPPANSLVRWVGRSGVSSNFQPLAGSYRALLGTGDLRLVRSDSLRARLASYAAAVESESERQGQFREIVTSGAGPMARALPFMRRAFLGDITSDGVDVARLRADPDAAAVLFAMQAATANKLTGLRDLREETRRLRRALQAEPGVDRE